MVSHLELLRAMTVSICIIWIWDLHPAFLPQMSVLAIADMPTQPEVPAWKPGVLKGWSRAGA